MASSHIEQNGDDDVDEDKRGAEHVGDKEERRAGFGIALVELIEPAKERSPGLHGKRDQEARDAHRQHQDAVQTQGIRGAIRHPAAVIAAESQASHEHGYDHGDREVCVADDSAEESSPQDLVNQPCRTR